MESVLPCPGLMMRCAGFMKNKDIWIIGGGGHSKVVIAGCQSAKIKVNGLFDDNPTLWNTLYWGIKIDPIPENDWWKNHNGFLAIGENKARQKLSQKIHPKNWATIIHPSAIIHPTASIGEGSYIGARVVIQPDVSIGQHVIINTGAIIEHDVKVESFCHIAPQTVLAGHVTVREGTLIGVGSAVIPGVTIDSWSIIGAGSAVIENISSHKVAAGVPCRIISHRALGE